MSFKRLFLLVILVFCFGVLPAQAQFGRNKVNYDNKEVKFYQSNYADFYHWQDIGDEKQIAYLEQIVQQVDDSYDFLSAYLGHQLRRRPSVVFYRTQSTFTNTYIIGNHDIPEGVLAFAEPGRYRLAIKIDMSLEEYNTTITHEMAHLFQFDMGPSFIGRMAGGGPAQWIMEGGAEFLANEYNMSRTDDLRTTIRRGAAANPEKDMPTLEQLNEGQADPYTFGEMTLEFIKGKYGADKVKSFLIQAFKDKDGQLKIISNLTDGAITGPEEFDELQRDYWWEKFGQEMRSKAKPYQENEYFKGRYMVPRGYPPYPMISETVSPDGKEMAVVTVAPQYGVVLAIIPTSDIKISQKNKNDKEPAKPGVESKPENKGWQIEILTPYLPPKHYEDISLGIDIPNISWVSVGDKEYIAFFAQSGRDHKLFVLERKSKKILQSIEVPLDNALSPALSPDGKKVYFTASKNITRDIYVIDLESKEVVNLTNDDVFDEAPAVSSDGTKIAYVSFVGSYRKIFLLDLLTGEKKQLTFNQFNDQAPSFSDDGRLLCFTSDEMDGVSNLYTLDLETNVISQRTDFYGRVFTPHFARGEKDKFFFVHYWQYRQFRSGIYKNFELFEAVSKQPYRQFVSQDNHEPTRPFFQPARDLFKTKLDTNQLLNPTKPSERWDCNGGQFQFGVSNLYGAFGQSFFGCSNLLETKQHLGQYMSYGSYRIMDYRYQNEEKRNGWSVGGHQRRMPMGYLFWDMAKRLPKQEILNNTWMNDMAVDFSTSHPFNKFNRVEFFSRLRRQSYTVYGVPIKELDESLFQDPDYFQEKDLEMFKFLKNSNGNSLSFGSAYVRDTVLYSQNAWGPLHGNALRLQFEAAPPAGNAFNGFVSANVDARMYRRLLGSDSVVFANRFDMMATNRANGEFMLLCGPETLRRCDYGSVAGNQIVYGSTELRFPIPGTYLLGQGVRGLLFLDGAYAKFSGENFPAQKLTSYGFGLQYILPFVGMPAQTIWKREDGQWKSTLYITIHW